MKPLTSRRVRVAASTSNLGPGFDLLGLALALPLTVELEARAEGGLRVRLAGGDESAAWPADGGLLALALGLALGDEDEPDLAAARARALALPATLHVRSEIPVARGLGSSGAAIAAGLLLGDSLRDAPRGLAALGRMGLALEGHPDNSTASLCGGCTLAVPHAGGLAVVRQEVHPDLRFALAWPASRVTTERARGVLPAAVPFADAVENPRRLALLLEGLRSGDPELLALGGEDRLHVPHRLALLPGAARALEAARAAGAFLATVSGSGSALVAIADEGCAAAAAEAMRAALAEAGESATARDVRTSLEPPRVEPVH